MKDRKTHRHGDRGRRLPLVLLDSLRLTSQKVAPASPKKAPTATDLSSPKVLAHPLKPSSRGLCSCNDGYHCTVKQPGAG